MQQQQKGGSSSSSPSDEEFPESFYCPLTHEVMRDPVVDPEGNSYERTAIEEWLASGHSTSPITRAPLVKNSLVPNRALREAIEARYKELGIEVPSPANNDDDNKNKNKNKQQANLTVTAMARKVQPVNATTTTIIGGGDNDKDQYDHDVLVSVKHVEGTKRSPTDFCCVIDISGSMGTEAKMKNESGQVESHGLSLLDIVKHAVKTIITSLQPEDRLALIAYSGTARIVFELTPMTSQAKKQATTELEKLHPDDMTNIWDGLQLGLELLRKESFKQHEGGRQAALLLLTDGLPNISPPRGEVQMLQRYKDQHQMLPCTISTFGFGYSINSELLRNIAILGDGMYAFIPDSSFVGTTFVHAVSNLLVTVGNDLRLSLEPLNGAIIKENGVLGGHITQYTSWGASVHLCSLQYGQSKDVVIRMTIPRGDHVPYLSVTFKYAPLTKNDESAAAACSFDATSRDGGQEVETQSYRLRFVDTVRKAMAFEELYKARSLIKEFADEVAQATRTNKDPHLKALLEDIRGQVTEAFSKDEYYKKWGVHYLPSLMRSHLLQQCNNFKDPGIQHYGGQLFRTIRDQVDDIFCKLPPPKPSVRRSASSSHYGSSSGSRQVSAPRSMGVYHSSSNPCFDGKCLVRMADGSKKMVQDLKKGDQVHAPNNRAVTVVCVVRTHCPQGTAELVELEGGLLVTPYHPVRLGGKWHFPCDLAQVAERPCSAVYSFVLEDEHVMVIDGVECVTLGHNLRDDDDDLQVVVGHPYFGSKQVIDDLQQMPGWSEGCIQFTSGSCLLRDPKSGLVSKFVQLSPVSGGA